MKFPMLDISPWNPMFRHHVLSLFRHVEPGPFWRRSRRIPTVQVWLQMAQNEQLAVYGDERMMRPFRGKGGDGWLRALGKSGAQDEGVKVQ
jgi:hypothetical protein